MLHERLPVVAVVDAPGVRRMDIPEVCPPAGPAPAADILVTATGACPREQAPVPQPLQHLRGVPDLKKRRIPHVSDGDRQKDAVLDVPFGLDAAVNYPPLAQGVSRLSSPSPAGAGPQALRHVPRLQVRIV